MTFLVNYAGRVRQKDLGDYGFAGFQRIIYDDKVSSATG
jgi:hypothetical protein